MLDMLPVKIVANMTDTFYYDNIVKKYLTLYLAYLDFHFFLNKVQV